MICSDHHNVKCPYCGEKYYGVVYTEENGNPTAQVCSSCGSSFFTVAVFSIVTRKIEDIDNE